MEANTIGMSHIGSPICATGAVAAMEDAGTDGWRGVRRPLSGVPALTRHLRGTYAELHVVRPGQIAGPLPITYYVLLITCYVLAIAFCILLVTYYM